MRDVVSPSFQCAQGSAALADGQAHIHKAVDNDHDGVGVLPRVGYADARSVVLHLGPEQELASKY